MKLDIFENKLKEKTTVFKEQINSLRVGGLSVDLIGLIPISVYGSQMVLREVAAILSSGPSELVVDPWDKSIVRDVESSLRSLQNSGFSVVSDGDKIRLKASELTLERRDALVKEISRKKEESKVAIRLIRQDQMRSVDEMEETGEITEDERFRMRDETEKLVKKYNDEIDKLAENKQTQVSSI